MPSFCTPFGDVPKPAITRPFAGQRNVGSAPVPSTVFVEADAGSNVDVVATLALCVSPAPSAVDDGAFACAVATAGVGLAFDVRTPGMVRRSPILSGVVGRMLLAFAISPTGLL